jgi:oligopeptide/dipeptide ABC transporter ATP-binding protein
VSQPVAARLATTTRATNLVRRPWARYAALVFLAIVVIAAIFAPLLEPRPAAAISLADRLRAPGSRAADGHRFLLGADALGRDVLSRLIAGGRVSLTIAVVVVGVSLLIGATLGLIAGSIGGRTDIVIMRTVDAQVAFPGLLFAILVISVAKGTLWVLAFVLAFHGWMIFTRVVRGVVIQAKGQLHIQAAELIGVSRTRVMIRHILPLARGPLVTQCLLEMARVILAEASLSYLGLGIQPPSVSWGLMVAENQQYLPVAWWTTVLPGLAILLTVVSLNVASTARAPHTPRPVRRLRADDNVASINARELATSASATTYANGTQPPEAGSLLSLRNVRISYRDPRTGDGVEAVAGVDLDVAPGQIVAVVGESGSGKTTLGLSIVDLLPAGAVVSGAYYWRGKQMSTGDRERLRGRSVGVVFQDPTRRLNPILPVLLQIAEVARKKRGFNRREARERARELLAQVGIRDVDRVARSLPYQLSGGMAQRVVIAACLAGSPELIVADEPTASLDVRVQAQILDLLAELRDQGVSILLVSHDLGVVGRLADRVLVMYAGTIVEAGGANAIFDRPVHPYSNGLLASIPRIGEKHQTLHPIRGMLTADARTSSGCPFQPRCDYAVAACEERPELLAADAVPAGGRSGEVAIAAHAAACWNPR